MTTSRPRPLLGAALGVLVVALAAQLPAELPAQAAPGAGTWTSITSPRDGAAFLTRIGHQQQMTITGTTSADVSTVTVYCLSGSGSSVDATTVATSVPVGSGAFSATVPVPTKPDVPQCRLRALPQGVAPQTTYLASYRGPVVDLDTAEVSGTDFSLSAATGDGVLVASSLGSCSTGSLGFTDGQQRLIGGGHACVLSLGQDAAGTHAAVRVDGHETLPASQAAGYTLAPSRPLRATFHVTTSGLVRWTDVESLDRCAGGDASYPPSSGCQLVPSGVEVRQSSTFLRSGHQVSVRTELRSTDGHRHDVRIAYTSFVGSQAGDAAQLGVRFPGEKAFRAPTEGRTVTALGRGAGTMLVRTDRLASADDPLIQTRALTWSRAPSRIAFSPTDASRFEMDYRLVVPGGGRAHLGFADSQGVTTAQAARTAAQGETDMVPAPRITSPKKGAVVAGRTTKVTGVVSLGANGLPTRVSVEGHAARLKPNKAGTKATFSVTFAESLGKHTLKVLVVDAAGNRRTTTTTVTNR